MLVIGLSSTDSSHLELPALDLPFRTDFDYLMSLASMTSNAWSGKASGKGHYASRGLSEFVSNLLESWHVPGISIAVVDGDDFLTEVSA